MTMLSMFSAMIKDSFKTVPGREHEKTYPRVDGQVWIVTGASGGIGYEVARVLASLGAKVWLVARTEAKLKECIANIKKEQSDAKLDYALVDLSDLTSVKPGIQKFLDAETELHGVIQNAGVMLPPQGSLTKQNLEMTVGTNNVGPQLLQHFLDPLLIETSAKSSEPGRLVWVASQGHHGSSLKEKDWANLDDHKDSINNRYYISKALNIAQAYYWTKDHPSANVLSVSVHPGVIQSDLYRHMNPIVKKSMGMLFATNLGGAHSELYAALNPTVPNNAFCVPYGRVGQPEHRVWKAITDKRGESAHKWLLNSISEYIN